MMLSNLPDLVITAAGAPGSAIVGNGQVIPLSWTVTNQGGDITGSAEWGDAVYLSPTQAYDAATAIPVDGRIHDVTLGLDTASSYTVTEDATVPNVPAGFPLSSAYLLFVANSGGGLTESNSANDVKAVPIALSAPRVDLAISKPGVSQTTAEAGNGQMLTFTWQVSNQGSDAAAAARTDSVYLANAATLAAATHKWSLGEFTPTAHQPTAAGATVSETIQAALPNVPAGQYDVIFALNTSHDQAETDAAQDANDATALPITVAGPNVDLAVKSASLATPATITEGTRVAVTYTVENLGSEAAGGSWSDAIYLSDLPNLGQGSNSQELTAVSPPSPSLPLGPQASYTKQVTVTIPATAPGSYYLVVATNIQDAQAETDDGKDANDTTAIPITLKAPALTAKIVSAPGSAIAGGTIPITYTVTNQGSVATVADWSDSVFLSPTQAFDPNTATWLQSFPTNDQTAHTDVAPLAAGASYTRTVNVTLSNAAAGSQYLVIVADDAGQPVTNADTSSAPAAIAVSAPDLKLVTANAPASAVLGSTIPISYQVQDVGSVAAPGDWTDSIFVSATPRLDDTATFVASFDHTSQAGGLAPGASYTNSQSITLPPTVIGTAYLIFVTNTDQSGTHAQGETS
jgi:hypothetical protein